MIEDGVMAAEDLEAVWEQIRSEVDDAEQFGEDSPVPDPSVLLDDVYSLPDGAVL